MIAEPEMITIAEAATLLRMSPSTVYKTYHLRHGRGVRILKANERARPRFYRSDILKMMEKPK